MLNIFRIFCYVCVYDIRVLFIQIYIHELNEFIVQFDLELILLGDGRYYVFQCWIIFDKWKV